MSRPASGVAALLAAAVALLVPPTTSIGLTPGSAVAQTLAPPTTAAGQPGQGQPTPSLRASHFVTPDVPAGQPPIDHPASAGSMQASAYADPGVLAYGNARFLGSPTGVHLSAPVVGMAARRDSGGYWLVAADGGVFTYGGAGYYGSGGGINLYAPIVGMAPTPDGGGYWLVALDGGVFTFGDAGFYGSTGAVRLNQPIVGMAPTPDGRGYWLVAADGGIFSFGDAGFYGSTGDIPLDAPVVGMAATRDGHGYWLVAADGGIFTFGDAPFYGSTGNVGLAASIAGMASTPDGRGYWLGGSDGAVFAFGDAVFHGSNSSAVPTPPIAAITATGDGGGYWLLDPDQFPTAFTHPGGSLIPSAVAAVQAAASQVGGNPVPGYYCNPYGPCEEWCALFATWVWETAGVPIPRYAWVGDIFTWAAAHTAVVAPSSFPFPGEAVLYGYGNNDPKHVGIVAQVWPDGAIVTVEGDAGPGIPGSHNVIINGPFLPWDSPVYNGFPIYAFAIP